jgi:hypothetical protein
MPLAEYLEQQGIELEPFEKQIYIDGQPTNYVARRNGDVVSYQRDCNNPTILKPIIIQRTENNKKDGTYNPKLLYRGVNLIINGKEKMFYLHRIIAETFIPNIENKPEVNHIDGDKGNNSVENLEWNTGSENQIHAFKNNLQKSRKGSKHHAAKINEETAYEICRLILYSNYSLREIAEKTNSTHPIVTKINKGIRWRHVSDKFGVSFPLFSNRQNNLKCSTTRES